MLGLATVGIPLDIFQLNPEIPTKPVYPPRREKPRDSRDRGNLVDISYDISHGTVVSVWIDGNLERCQRFEDHWWGKPRRRAAEAQYEQWRAEYPQANWGGGNWMPMVMGW